MLAVAQTDDVVFVYRLGVTWGDKKTICNKFWQQNPQAYTNGTDKVWVGFFSFARVCNVDLLPLLLRCFLALDLCRSREQARDRAQCTFPGIYTLALFFCLPLAALAAPLSLSLSLLPFYLRPSLPPSLPLSLPPRPHACILPCQAVTALCWPSQRPNELVFGMADGQVKVGILKSNRSVALYDTKSCVVALASSPDGQSFVSGHLDGAVYLYTFPNGTVLGQATSVQQDEEG